MRSIRQPGPPSAERALIVKVGTRRFDMMLPAGVRLLDALAVLLDDAESACLTLTGGGFGPFGYVIPALSPDATRAAFYSEPFRPAGESRLDTAALTLGWREGSPFFHCHALWTEAGRRRGCGHVLPDETFIHSPIRARGVAITAARFEVTPDPETGFSLFVPKATGTRPPANSRPGVAIRLCPNQDLTEGLERAARAAGFARAVVQGGVASIIGARFADAPPIEAFATEMLVTRGEVGAVTELDIAIVDRHGAIGQGRLVPGDNPVLMTFEGVLEAAA